MKDRIKKIMDQESLNPATFADLLNINRQTMIASLGRNKTISIHIITAILEKIPDINSDWLLFGKGPIYKGERAYLQPTLFDENTGINPDKEQAKDKYAKDSIVQPIEKGEQIVSIQRDIPPKIEDKKIDKIMIFYTDKTFITLIPEE